MNFPQEWEPVEVPGEDDALFDDVLGMSEMEDSEVEWKEERRRCETAEWQTKTKRRKFETVG